MAVGSVRRSPTLEEARRLTEPALRAALDRLDPRTRRVCGYHLGFWDTDGTTRESGGKWLRPALALLSARAAGADPALGVPAAVAVELVHNFSLLHDDVMDGDAERRHRPAAWAAFGVPAAILAGDAMLSLASEVLADAPAPAAPGAVRYLGSTTRCMIAGQTADLDLPTSPAEVSVEDSLRTAADKTGALLACSASLGAVLADGPADLALALADWGAHVGLAFQIQDDLLGIYGQPDRVGKPVGSDLRSRKRSVPVAAALASGTPEGAELAVRYARADPPSDDELAYLAALVDRSGGRGFAQRAADVEWRAASDALAASGLSEGVRRELGGLADWLRQRHRQCPAQAVSRPAGTDAGTRSLSDS